MPDLNGVPQLAEEKHHIGRQALANIAANPEYLRQSARQAVGPLAIRQQPSHFLLKFNGGRLPVFSLWQLALPRLRRRAPGLLEKRTSTMASPPPARRTRGIMARKIRAMFSARSTYRPN